MIFKTCHYEYLLCYVSFGCSPNNIQYIDVGCASPGGRRVSHCWPRTIIGPMPICTEIGMTPLVISVHARCESRCRCSMYSCPTLGQPLLCCVIGLELFAWEDYRQDHIHSSCNREAFWGLRNRSRSWSNHKRGLRGRSLSITKSHLAKPGQAPLGQLMHSLVE